MRSWARGEGPVWPDLRSREFLENLPDAVRPHRYLIDPSGDFSAFYVDGVVWRYGPPGGEIELHCDRLYLYAPRFRDLLGSRERPDEPVEFYLYAEGAVRLWLRGRETTVEASSVYYDHRERLAVAEEARVVTSMVAVQSVVRSMRTHDLRGTRLRAGRDSLERSPLVVSARLLRAFDFSTFEGEDVVVTTCDFEMPHWGLRAARTVVRPVPQPPAGEAPEEGVEGMDFLVDLDSPRLEIAGTAVLPLPLTHWDTRWHDFFPLRAVDAGSESKFGKFAGAEWNLNFFLKHLPLGWAPPVERALRDSRLGFETTYLEKRGLGWGPLGEYGTRPGRWRPWQLGLEDWTYYGEGRYFRIDDHGEDRSNDGLPPPDSQRFWGSVVHRQSIPNLGLLDVEWSEQSDRFFLREYFEDIDKEEKEQESLVYLRRNFRDNTAATVLYKYRANDFEEEVERLPEGKFLMYQEPVFGTGLYTDLGLEAANLRLRPRDDRNLAARRLGRFDVLNEWAYPVAVDPYLDARPFFFMRLSGYEELADPDREAADRASFGGGVTVSQQWSRVFDLEAESLWNRWFGIRKLKHALVPKVSYLNLFANDLEPEETLGLDEVDTVGEEEALEFSLRQALVTRTERPGGRRVPTLLGDRALDLETLEYTTRSILDSEVSLAYFPRSGRDNDGDPLSLLLLDNTFRPGSRVSLRAWFELDPNESFRLEVLAASVKVDWVPDVFSTTVWDRLSRKTARSEETNVVSLLASFYLTEKWEAQAYYSRDTDRGTDLEYSFALVRVFHRFALMLEYSLDVNEDRNQTVSVNFAPLELIGSRRHRGRRW